MVDLENKDDAPKMFEDSEDVGKINVVETQYTYDRIENKTYLDRLNESLFDFSDEDGDEDGDEDTLSENSNLVKNFKISFMSYLALGLIGISYMAIFMAFINAIKGNNKNDIIIFTSIFFSMIYLSIIYLCYICCKKNKKKYVVV